MNWKEEFEKHFNYLGSQDGTGTIEGYKSAFEEFISTEVIEKLIEEIPHRPRLGSDGLKKHLKAKWLGKESND